MTFTVVTTFHKKGYETYGRRMIETFLKNWPKNIMLIVYAEDCTVTETAPNLIVRDLNQVDELVTFKNKWRGVPKANEMLVTTLYVLNVKMLEKVLNGMPLDLLTKSTVSSIVLAKQTAIGCYGWMLTWFVIVLSL